MDKGFYTVFAKYITKIIRIQEECAVANMEFLTKGISADMNNEEYTWDIMKQGTVLPKDNKQINYNMKLNFKPEQFKPVDGNVLVQPGPIKKINTVEYKVQPSPVDVKGDKQVEPEVTYEKKATLMRLGKVLAISENILTATDATGKLIPVGFAVGDWVVYNSQRGYNQKLDLLAKKSDDDKCPILMQRFEIVSKVNVEE